MQLRGDIKQFSAARVCLLLSIVLFVMGGFILCACPGVPALSAVFAAMAFWRGSPRVRIWSTIFFVAALVGAAVMIKEERTLAVYIKKIHEAQAVAQQTNQPAK